MVLEDSEEVDTPPLARQLVVVGGGRGGSGKTLVASNLAIYFAQLGKRVTLIDRDATGSNLHAQFALAAGHASPAGSDAEASLSDRVRPTEVPGLSVVPYPHDAPRKEPTLRGSRKARFLAAARALPADYIILDVGAGNTDLQCDLLLSSDMPILVTSCDPPGVEATYRLIKSLFLRRVRRAFARDRLRLALLDRILLEHGGLPSPIEVDRLITRADARVSEPVVQEARHMLAHLVVNQTRARQDAQLGEQVCELATRHLGARVTELGHIEYDDSAWVSLRRSRPLLLDSPATKAARNIERIARRTLTLLSEKGRNDTAPTAEAGHYGLLGVGRASSDEEIRKAYKRKREIYASGSLAITSLFSAEGLRTEQAKFDEAYDTLLDPIRRRAYDLSLFADAGAEGAQGQKPSIGPEQVALQRELLREIAPDTAWSGTLLRRVRESQGVAIAEISERTRISRTYLDALEREDMGALPALVYVRGFVAELAKYLRLDPLQVQASYLKRLRDVQRRGAG
jgi:flagellar biosynthesis protein FlhG